jgi:excisionase family DNA binding protein
MTITEAAKRLDLSPKTLRQQIKNRKLRAHKMGRTWFVSDDEVARYAMEHRRGNGDD